MIRIKEGHQLYRKSDDKAIAAKSFEIIGDNAVLYYALSSPRTMPLNELGICDIHSEEEYELISYK